MSRKSFIVFVLCILLAGLPLAASAAPANNVNILVVNNAPAATEEVANGNGLINWETDTIEAIGTGVPPANAKSPAQAKGLARRAAIVDAQRNLLESIKGVQVDSETTMENLTITSDVVKTKVSGLVKGARIVREQQMPDGSYQVVMAVKMFGQDGLAGAIENNLTPAAPQPLPPVSDDYVPPTKPSAGAPVVAPRQYTGLVVDARDLGLERSMAPMVYDTDGRIIYGNMYVDHSYVVQNGLVDYAGSLGAIELVDNGQSRAGQDPVVVKAVSLRDNNHNVVISKADGDAVLAASGPTGFMLKCAVVFKH